MAIAEKIYERARQLPAEKAVEVLDFIGYLEMKLGQQQQDDDRERPMTTKEFLDRFAGAIPDFPNIEDEGSLQERDPL
ncbi:MAG: hypothetical protein HW380_54 [Magnetococcales bacterium]|nr:hypothetical protein [Magnetococcales bacterium]HIJ82713.1 DUF2281 domain-containing protein [Magnetococcales bacterium]